MVNGFWLEAERDQAEAAAQELRNLGLSNRQLAFSQEVKGAKIEYDTEGRLRTWIKGRLRSGNVPEPEPEAEPPIVLRTWPSAEQAAQVCQIMNRHGAHKVNHWEAGPAQQPSKGSETDTG